MAALAVMEVAEVAEGTEAAAEVEAPTALTKKGTGKSAFKQDSLANAKAQGVDFSGFGKIAGEGIGLVVKIVELVRDFQRGKAESDERRKQRYSAGIVYSPEENRDNLIRRGEIPAYYSSSNIRALLSDNLLPHGWSNEVAIGQGFLNEIRAGEFRVKNKAQAEEILSEFDAKRKIRQQVASVEALDKRLRLNKALQQLKIY